MQKFDYIERTKCAVTGDTEFESLFEYDFPLFCGCTNEPKSEDVVARTSFVISKPSGVVQLKRLIPLDLLYKNGHDAGSVGALWEEHHEAFADFVMGFAPQKVLEIGGGHGKLALKCLEKGVRDYSIIEPNSTKHEKITYIDGFFGRDKLGAKYDTVVHSHTFEHIYEPNEFLAQIYDALSGKALATRERERERERDEGGSSFPYQICKGGLKTNSQTA